MGKIPIVLCFDSRILLGAAVTIKSIITNAKKETVYDFRIFHSEISTKNQNELKGLLKDTKHNMQFHYIDPKRFKNAPKSKGSWTEIVYYRLLTAEILTDYDKAIYSDVDVFVKDDLSELYATDLEGYEAAAVPSYTTEYLKRINSKRYFEENKNEKNYMSGLILFNNKVMREEGVVNKFFETIEKYGERLVYFDMDVFNITCNRIKDLPLNYCVLETIYEYTDCSKVPEYEALKNLYTKEDLENIRNNPKIIHYAGKMGKPWQRKWVPDYYSDCIKKLPKSLVKYTFRDFRKKYFSKIKYPLQHYDVGIVNFYHTQNYGACLTAYALQECLKNLGYNCAFVNEFTNKKKHLNSFGRIFVNKYLKQMPRFNNTKKAGNLADIYITGSDQVLRPSYLKKKKARNFYLLDFVNKNAKKIAFSASFGIGEEEFNNSKKSIIKRIKQSLSSFDYISNREFSGIEICKNSLELYSEQILDPVFLLDKKKFEDLASNSGKDFKNKIVTYILDKNNSYEGFYKKINDKYGLEICNLAKSGCSVEDWLKAFVEAEYIITDSFHGACFAIIFNKPFIAVINKKRGATRFETLSKLFDIKNSFIENLDVDSDFENLDFGKINKQILEKRECDIQVLKRELGTKKKSYITNNCTGCGACYNACPKGAIKMVENNEGFLYPQIDSKLCVNCGLCKKTCPTNSKIKITNTNNPQCYAVMANDTIRMSGVSSGGASVVLMEKVLTNGGFIAGAVYNDEWRIEHIITNDSSLKDKFKGSKYFQSNTKEVYGEIKTLLNKDELVLFTGTPCQVAGLKSFLKKDYPNLLTVDIVCHGVPPYKIFEMYTKNLLMSEDEKILGVNFRDKKYGWGPRLHLTTTTTTTTTYEVKATKSAFMTAFLRNLAIRKSCFSCPFQKTPRQGDITIGDFWRVHKYKESLDDKKGTSLLLVNNEKGRDFFEKVKSDFTLVEKVPYKYAVKGNKTLVMPTSKNKKRDWFMLNVTQNNFNDLVKKALGKKFEG